MWRRHYQFHMIQTHWKGDLGALLIEAQWLISGQLINGCRLCSSQSVQNKHIPDKKLHLYKAAPRDNPPRMTLQINTLSMKRRQDCHSICTTICHQILDLVIPHYLLTYSITHPWMPIHYTIIVTRIFSNTKPQRCCKSKSHKDIHSMLLHGDNQPRI